MSQKIQKEREKIDGKKRLVNLIKNLNVLKNSLSPVSTVNE